MPSSCRHQQKALESRQFCTAAFLDISQAFDKLWHPGLLYKIKNILPTRYISLLKSYLEERHFVNKYNNEASSSFQIHSEVPEVSILGPCFTYYTHLNCRHPGTQRWAHSRMIQPYLRPMQTPRQPHATFRIIPTP